MPYQPEILRQLTRRQFFGRASTGIGTVALASLLNRELFAADTKEAPKPHFAPKAKRVIYLFMAGGPSQLDLFDPKPKLKELEGKPVPAELVQGQRFAFIGDGKTTLLGSPYKFAKHGKSGQVISEQLPQLAEVADDIAIVRSMHTDVFNHDPATIFLNTGSPLAGRPSMGSWLTYGLGSKNQNLPGFVVLCSYTGDNVQPIGTHCWSSGFLPTVHQGVQFHTQGDPVLFVNNPAGMNGKVRRQSLDALRDLNQMQLETVGDPEIATRIAAFEMAYGMQTSVPRLMDIAAEPMSDLEMYGAVPGRASLANNCLLARRLAEQGVRFIQLYHRDWDHHANIYASLPVSCKTMDRPVAALLKDLKRRRMLDETLVIWGGEFGRTPMIQGDAKIPGRDHHPRAFTMWLAGGGIKPGITLGTTDDFGYNVVQDPVHVHDLHATILHLLGLDHTKLTYKFQGREFRLTDVAGKVIKKLLA